MTNAFKEKGFDRVALFSRNPIAQFNTESERAFLKASAWCGMSHLYPPQLRAQQLGRRFDDLSRRGGRF